MRIAVLGAGTSGLFAALVLARDGHDVVIVDKDPRPAPIDAASIATWHRPGTPQTLLPHGFMARGRMLMRDHAPDVSQCLVDAGAVDFALAPFVPGGSRLPADDELVVTFCRRPLLESALWQAVRQQRNVDLRTETTVTGLALPGTVVTDRGELHADLIVDAAGRRSPLWKWLDAPSALTEECGMVYYSRYYRLRPTADLPAGPWLWGPRAELPFALAIVHLADRDFYSITFGVPTFDAELKILRDAQAFTAACTALPSFAPWVAPARAEPVGDVLAMGGLQNVLHPFLRDDRPIAPGVIPIGDALCHTNAAYGWGMSLGFEHAVALAEVLRETEELDEVAAAYHARVWPEAEARWELSVQQDRARTRQWRGEPPPPDDTRATALRRLTPAVMLDPGVFRAVMRSSLLLDRADALLDPSLLARAVAAIDRRGPVAASPTPPTRAEWLAAFGPEKAKPA